MGARGLGAWPALNLARSWSVNGCQPILEHASTRDGRGASMAGWVQDCCSALTVQLMLAPRIGVFPCPTRSVRSAIGSLVPGLLLSCSSYMGVCVVALTLAPGVLCQAMPRWMSAFGRGMEVAVSQHIHGMDERGRCFTAVLSTLWLSRLVLNEPGLAMPGITDARDVHGRCWSRRTNVCRTTTDNPYVVELCMGMKIVL